MSLHLTPRDVQVLRDMGIGEVDITHPPPPYERLREAYILQLEEYSALFHASVRLRREIKRLEHIMRWAIVSAAAFFLAALWGWTR